MNSTHSDARRTADAADTGTGDREHTTDGQAGARRLLRSFLLGLEGGAFATLVMTAFRMPISGSLPPTADFLARFVGGDAEDYSLAAFALHFAYGVAGGGLFGVLFDEPDGRTRAETELRDVTRGLAFGLAFSLFGSRVVLGRLVGMDLDPDEALMFHVGHAVYGLTIGAWTGSNR